MLLLLPGLCSVIICALYRDKKLVSKSQHHADDLANFYVAACLAGSSIFVAGIVAEPLVRERARRLRNLLSVSGLDARAYWLGTAAADYAILFVGVVVTLIALKSGSVARKADSSHKLCINQILTARLRNRWIMASTPSTRHLLEGVEVSVPRRSTEPARPRSRRERT